MQILSWSFIKPRYIPMPVSSSLSTFVMNSLSYVPNFNSPIPWSRHFSPNLTIAISDVMIASQSSAVKGAFSSKDSAACLAVSVKSLTAVSKTMTQAAHSLVFCGTGF